MHHLLSRKKRVINVLGCRLREYCVCVGMGQWGAVIVAQQLRLSLIDERLFFVWGQFVVLIIVTHAPDTCSVIVFTSSRVLQREQRPALACVRMRMRIIIPSFATSALVTARLIADVSTRK